MIHPGCSSGCVKAAYLRFARPDLMEAITSCVREGAERVIVHPYFLSSGTHVTRDIPAIIRKAEAMYPDVEFICTAHLGVHDRIARVVLERIEAATGLAPGEIEKKSFEIISDEIDLSDVPVERLPVVKRVIHTTADFEYKTSLVFHPDAVRTGIAAIKAGRDILTDVEMVRTGINKRLLNRWGGRVVCSIQDSELKVQDTEKMTRAERGIMEALKENGNIGIIAIGNAPTALLKTIDILNNAANTSRPAGPLLVIGVPVGFVRAVESKSLLAAQDFPFITNLSRKGGSAVAAAIVNALLNLTVA
ncbi:MAG: hypothetical protein GXP46_13625 [Deferribacteres bacterium]|nr:hypothetical protein [Deferribacteres bacterium]